MSLVHAWHFTGDTLRGGLTIPAVGETLRHGGALQLCVSGLHASERIIDALTYAPGPIIHRVRCGGELHREGDKLVCRERTIHGLAVRELEAEVTVLHSFTRGMCSKDGVRERIERCRELLAQLDAAVSP